MNVLVPCKTKEEVIQITRLFRGEINTRFNLTTITNDKDTIYIFVYNECTICGMRGQYIMLSNKLSRNTIENLMPYLCPSPEDFRKALAMETKKLMKGDVFTYTNPRSGRTQKATYTGTRREIKHVEFEFFTMEDGSTAFFTDEEVARDFTGVEGL